MPCTADIGNATEFYKIFQDEMAKSTRRAIRVERNAVVGGQPGQTPKKEA